MKKLLMILIICLIGLKILISEEIQLINQNAWNKLKDNEKYSLCNDLIKLCNNLKTSLDKKNKEIEKLKKQIKLNQIGFLFGYGLNTKLENNIIFNVYYNRFLFSLFGFGFGITYNFNTNNIHTIFLNVNFSILF